MQCNPIQLVGAQACHVEAIKACAHQAYQCYVERMNKTPAPMIADFEKLVLQESVVVALATDEQVVGDNLIQTSGSSGDELLGFVVFYPTQSGMHLENIAVLPSTHGHGVGTKLVAHVEQQAKALELSRVHLYTNIAMHENFSWYKHLGYLETERKYQDGFERVFFEKNWTS